MDRRQSGVAHVNIFWAIVPMVLMLGAAFYGYTGHTEADKFKGIAAFELHTVAQVRCLVSGGVQV